MLTKSLYRALKIYAVNHDKDMSEVVTEALHKLGIEGRSLAPRARRPRHDAPNPLFRRVYLRNAPVGSQSKLNAPSWEAPLTSHTRRVPFSASISAS